MLKTIRIFLSSFPIKIIAWKIYCKLFNIKIPAIKNWQHLFINKKGIEIGGPSAVFRDKGYMPLYSLIQSLDGVNFSTTTVWEGNLTEGDFYKYQNKTGYQYISEGSNLPVIKDGKYDFVLSCNNLEHIGNPIAAVLEWKRILKPAGVILLILPNKKANFDHNRPYTSINHLISDYEKAIDEHDMTHKEEILQLHDLTRDPQARPFSSFKQRCAHNFQNRCMHHHVFNQELLKELFQFCEMEVLFQHSSNTDHYIAAVKKQ